MASDPIRAAVWLRPDQTELVRAVADLTPLSILHAGTPTTGDLRPISAALGAEPVGDLRTLLTEADVDLILLADPGGFGTDASSRDAEAALAALGNGVRLASMEPVPGRLTDLLDGRWLEDSGGRCAADAVRFVPLTRAGRMMRTLPDLLEQFGHVRSVSVRAWSGPQHGSLGARLYSALELIHALFGPAESVDAACTAPGQGSGVHLLPGDSLRGLEGDLHALLRFSDGRSASLALSDQAGRWNRSLTLIGQAGRISISADGLEWIDPAGQTIDRSADSPADLDPMALELADNLTRLVDPNAPGWGPTDHTELMALAHAALLSARTGQAESPQTIRQMMG